MFVPKRVPQAKSPVRFAVTKRVSFNRLRLKRTHICDAKALSELNCPLFVGLHQGYFTFSEETIRALKLVENQFALGYRSVLWSN